MLRGSVYILSAVITANPIETTVAVVVSGQIEWTTNTRCASMVDKRFYHSLSKGDDSCGKAGSFCNSREEVESPPPNGQRD